MRGISNLLALLIVLTIVIGIAIAVSGIGAKILMSFEPKGSDLVAVGFVWWWSEKEDGSFIIYIRGVVHNIGRETINITDMWLSYGGKEYHLDFKKIRLKPNKFSEVHGRVAVSKLPEHSPITVFIKWCTAKKCSISFVSAQVSDTNYLVREEYHVITITQPVPTDGGSSITITVTETVTTTAPSATTTITSTITSTTTTTITQTETMTTTTTATITKPAWPIQWSSCYGIDDYIYVFGDLDRKVNKDAEAIPYVLKVYDCTVLGCSLLGVVPFEWMSSKSIQAKYGPVQVKPFHSIKIEIWSININMGSYKDKIYEETVDTSVRCA